MIKTFLKMKWAFLAIGILGTTIAVIEPWGQNSKSSTAASKNANCIADENAFLDMRKKQEELKALQEKLSKQDDELKAKETALNEEIKKLDDIKKQISTLETSNKEREEEKIARLVEAFEKMSAKNAAKILTDVSDEMAVLALNRLSTDKIAKVLGAMDSKRASKLSELMTLKKVYYSQVQLTAN